MKSIASPRLVALVSIALLPLTAGCSTASGPSSKKGDAAADAPAAPDLNAPTFANVFHQVIQKKGCSQVQCHGQTDSGGLRMDALDTAYTNLVGVPAAGLCTDAGTGKPEHCGCATSGKMRVEAGSPTTSLLIDKLGGNPSCGDPMPPTGLPISSTLLDLVTRWITAGAKND